MRMLLDKDHRGESIETAWALLVLALITAIAYWNSFKTPFVFDDFLTIQKNAGVRFGDFLHPALFGTRSILYMTFAANYLVSGQTVWGYHLVNLLLHVLNGILVFRIAAHLFREAEGTRAEANIFAFWASALFLLHPVQTESVTYISSRSELLSTFFYVLVFFVYISVPVNRIGFSFSLIVAIPFLLGLLSKETVITLPAALLLYEFIFRCRGEVRPLFSKWRFYITFFAFGAIAAYFLVTRVLVGSIGRIDGNLSPWSYFLTESRVMVRYLRVLILPAGLNLDYDFVASHSIFETQVMASILVLICLAAGAWHFRRRQPLAAFAIFWFFITLLPTSSFVPIRDVIFEHRLYLPLAGSCLLFPVLVREMAQLAERRWGGHVRQLYCCAGVIIFCIAGTVLRNEVWGDEARLWSDVVAKSPHKVRGYSGLSFAYYKRGEYGPALRVAKLGLAAAPDGRYGFLEAIGNMNLKLGRYDDAVSAVQQTVNISEAGQRSESYNNLGVCYLYMWNALNASRSKVSGEYFEQEKQRILGKSKEAFLKSFESDPHAFSALDSYINVVHESGAAGEVERELRSRFTETDFRLLYGLGKAALLDTDYARAAEYFQRASRSNTEEKLLYFNHAIALTQLNRTDAAIEQYRRALRLDPLFREAHFNVALLFAGENHFPEALEHFQDVLRMDPRNSRTHLEMARIYARDGQRSLAREHLGIVLRDAPQYPDAQALLQQLGS